MKSKLINLVRKMAGWPFIGRFIRFGVSIIRRPIFRGDLRLNVFESQQLPTLLQSLSDLNHRQLTSDKDKENLVNSVPVALRKLTRDLLDVKEKLDKTADSVSHLMNKVGVDRRELMCEIYYRNSLSAASINKVKTEVLNTKKLMLAREEKLKINLSCGHIPINDYLNIDRRKLPGVDILAEFDQLPFESGEVDEIFSMHLLECFPEEKLRLHLLPYYVDLLKTGGVFRAVVTDVDAVILNYVNGQCSYDDLREIIYGSQNTDESFKFNGFTQESFKKLLAEAGLTDVVIVKAGNGDGKFSKFELSAVKQ